MLFSPTGLADAWVIDAQPLRDSREFFARSFCSREFATRGIPDAFVQHSLSQSENRYTLRGLHFQRPPHEEAKVVGCMRGAIYDVIIDLRPGSSTFGRWAGFELTASNLRQIYIPKGFAHGFQTLSENTLVNYLISEFHVPGAAQGIRYDDPELGIEWPAAPTVLSDRDRAWPSFQNAVEPEAVY